MCVSETLYSFIYNIISKRSWANKKLGLCFWLWLAIFKDLNLLHLIYIQLGCYISERVNRDVHWGIHFPPLGSKLGLQVQRVDCYLLRFSNSHTIFSVTDGFRREEANEGATDGNRICRPWHGAWEIVRQVRSGIDG